MKKSKDNYSKGNDKEEAFDNKKTSKSGYKKKSKTDSRWLKDERSVGRNDVSWYTPDVALLNDAGRWPYSRPVGTPLGRESLLHLVDQVDDAVPGLCVAETMITYGNSQDGNSALNVAANAMYTYVRHVNSGSRNYDSPDLMIYVGSVDSIYAFITWMTRAYSTIMMFADSNKYLPNDIGLFQHLDLDDIRENMANWRANFNALIMKVGTLVVPDNLPIFRRHAMLFQNYYSEGPSIKDQIYFHTLMNVYKYQLDSSGAGMLKYVSILDYANPNTGLLGAAETLKLLEDLITPIFNDEDFNIMSGDILKAYDGKIMRLMLLPEAAVSIPINNVTFLEQFKNLRAVGGRIDTLSGRLDVTQDANKEYLIVDQQDLPLGFYFGNSIITPSSATLYPDITKGIMDQWSRNLILTTEVTDVTPEVNMLNTRLVSMPDVQIDSTSPIGLSVKDTTFGSEIVGTVIYVFHDKSWSTQNFSFCSIVAFDANNNAHVSALSRAKDVISSFRFHPAHDFIAVDTSASPMTFGGAGIPNFGIDNFTTIDFDHVKTLNDVAILGEYNVPRLAVLK